MSEDRIKDAFPFEVVIVQRDGSTDQRALFYAASDATAFAEIRPGYYGAEWVARRRSDGRVVTTTKGSSLEYLRKDMMKDACRQVEEALRRDLHDELFDRPAIIGKACSIVRKAMDEEPKREPNWMGLGHGTRILDILNAKKRGKR